MNGRGSPLVPQPEKRGVNEVERSREVTMGRVTDREHPMLPKAGRRLRLRLAAAMLLLALSQTGCIGVGLTALGAGLGVGAGTATSYTLNGFAYRTFAVPLPKVERATLMALRNMGIRFEEREAIEEALTSPSLARN
jgi:hypothetical protein